MRLPKLRALVTKNGFEPLFRDHPDAIILFDGRGAVIDLNPAALDRLGYSLDEVRDLPPGALMAATDRPAAVDAFMRARRGETVEFLATFLRKDGARVRSRITAVPVADRGRTVAVMGIARDLSEIEKALLASENFTLEAHAATRLAPFGRWTFDVGAGVLAMSEELRNLLGYSSGDGEDGAGGRRRWFPDQDYELVVAAIRQCIDMGTPFELQTVMYKADGSELRVRVAADPVFDADGYVQRIVGVTYDFTEDYERLAAAEQRERLLTEALDNSAEGLVLFDDDFTLRYVNPAAAAFAGRTPEAMIGRALLDIFPEVAGTERGIAYIEAQRNGTTTTVTEYVERSSRWLEVSVERVPQGVAIHTRDVTDTVEARLKLAEAERQVAAQAALLDVARDAIIVRGLDHVIQYWNRSAEEMYGWTASEAVGSLMTDLVYAGSPGFESALANTLRDGYWSGEIEQRGKGGRKIIAESTWTLVRNSDGAPEAVFSVNADVTEKRRLNEMVLRTQRMESLGTLAGGIAHDLNNVLTPILMSVQMLAREEHDPVRGQIFGIIESGVKRGADMVRQVLSFARGVEGERAPIDVGELLDNLARFTRETMPKQISVAMMVEPDLWPPMGDSTQLLQVLINLATNARDAMPNGGILAISAKNVTLKDSYSSVSHLATPGRYVQIEVEDDGIGMPSDIVTKIFEPFFTTKDLGEGTGLGLSTSIAIIRSHGGYMQVYSELGRGSRFQLHLPAIGEGAGVGESTVLLDVEDEFPRGDGQLVLVVDDEAAIRQITRQTLEAYGYTTAVASNGAEAIAYVSSATRAVDLVFTDMSMPVMDGATAAAYLIEHYPGLPIIATSGLNANGGVARAMGSGVTHFVAKPYTTTQLLTAVAAALRRPEGEEGATS